MTTEFTQADLEAYLDEALTPAETSRLEETLRGDKTLVKRLGAIIGRRDAGVHSLGEIWRRHRVACADRETLGSYLLNVLDPEHQELIRFHIEEIGCRICLANLQDLQQRQSEQSQATQLRRQRYFQSSAGYLGSRAD